MRKIVLLLLTVIISVTSVAFTYEAVASSNVVTADASEVDNVTGAWISETPLQSIGADTIGEYQESVLITVNDENTYAQVEVPFADLERAGVDIENIEDYFGAYIELVNCRVDNTGGYIYRDYEYLAGINKENKLVTTDADVVYNENGDSITIESKIHYLYSGNRNYLELYTISDPADGWELVEDVYYWDDYDYDGRKDDDEWYLAETISDQLEGRFYDVTFIDTDVDGYYEVALVNYYNLDTYKAPRFDGREICGVMKEVEAKYAKYSEVLSVGDAFVYTYDYFMNRVDVKGILRVDEGKITSYSEVIEEDYKGYKYTVATIGIDDEEYEVSFYGVSDKIVNAFGNVGTANVGYDEEIDLGKVRKSDVADFASINVGGEYEYCLFNDMLLAFGKEVELAADNYLVVETFTDFEIYDHVVLSALVNGAEEEIKVKKIYEKQSNGDRTVWADIEDLGYGKLANKLEDIFGIYFYAVDADGFYTLTKHNATLQLKDFVSTVGSGYVSFSDWETTSVVDTNGNGNSREEIIRVNSATTIYLVNKDKETVELVKPSSYFTINIANDTDPVFMIDRIGYGNTEKEYADGIGFGVASVIYIVTNGEYINYEDCKFVYVQEDVSSISSGSATKYELETGDEEEMYFKYVTEDGDAYFADTFVTVEEIYVSDTYRNNYLGSDLVPGLYLLNSDNIVIDHKTVAELSAEQAVDRYLTYDKAQIKYDVWAISADDIDLYNYKYKTIDGKSGLIGDKIQNIKFRFLEESDGDIFAVDKSNQELVDYMEYNFGYEDDPGIYYDVNVLIIPNTPSGFNRNFPFTDDTLTGIVFDEVTSDDPSITIPPVETASAPYLVVTDCTDFEIYDHVVLSALVNGAEEEIKVKKIYEKQSNGDMTVWADIEDLGYGKLANKLEDIFGIYSYAVDADGFYTLTKHNATLQLKDFVSTVDHGYVNFSDWETTSVVDTNGNGNSREEIIRVNSDTTIYVADIDKQEVTVVKPYSYFSINLNNDTDPVFMIDRIGYGNPYEEYDVGINYGVSSVIYIETTGEFIDYPNYKFVYIQKEVPAVSSGYADKLGLETADEDEVYYKYDAFSGEAYLADTLAPVESIYVSKSYRNSCIGSADLVPGLYLLNSDNIVMDHKTVAELSAESAYDRYLTYNKAQIKYDVWAISADDIDLYNYKYKTIDGKNNHIGDKIQNIKFRFLEESDGDIFAVDKSNQALVDYMIENFCNKLDPEDETTWDYLDVSVLIIPNTTTGFNKNLEFTNDTLTGIVFDEVIYGYGGIQSIIITYDANGGTCPIKLQAVTPGSIYGTLPVPTREGYKFDGWYTMINGGTKIENTSIVSYAVSDKTLYAHWSANEYTVTYNAKGGSGAPLAQTKTHDIALTLSSDVPTRDGYSFKGWATSVSGSVAYAAGDSYTENEDATLYAVWEKDEIVIPETDANIVTAGGRGRAGETVDVTISLENNPGIAFMCLSVDYDSNAIKLVDVKDAGILGIEVHSDNLMADTYTLYWENSTIKNNITSNGTAVTLTFEINENTATGSYPVTVTYDNTNDDIMDVDFGEVYFNVVNGVVEVVDFIYGDVNGDFEVTPVDSATLSRYLAKWTGYGEDMIDPDASDVNCDGSVTAVDSAMLSRHLAKWTGYETLPIEE